MVTNFTTIYFKCLSIAQKTLPFQGHTLLIRSWEDQSFELEIRSTHEGLLHRFIYKSEYKELVHIIIDHSKSEMEYLGKTISENIIGKNLNQFIM